MGVNKGDVLVIPAPNGQNKNDKNKLTIEWSQMLRQNRGDYYVLIAKNKSQGYAEVAFFIQSEWYNEQGFNSAYNMRRIDDDNYELTMDDRHQYAGEGDSRFVVWHDKNRKPYANRFVQTGFLPLVGGISVLQDLSKWGQNFLGTELQTF